MSLTKISVLTATDTVLALPYPALARQIEGLLSDPAVVVPARIVQALPGGSSLFVMPAANARVAITKLITFTPDNDQRSLPRIQGDIVVLDVATGSRIAILDGARPSRCAAPPPCRCWWPKSWLHTPTAPCSS